MISDAKVMTLRILLLVLGGASFVIFQKWFILPLVGLIWFLFEINADKEKNKKYLKIALLFGIILMVFDFAFENWGAMYGYWVTLSSSLPVLAVPIEIMLTCIFGGAAWFLFIRNYKNKYFIIINMIFWSFGGMFGESFLIQIGFMAYGNGWVSIPHAFVSYFIIFVIFYYLSFFIIKKVNKK